MSEFLGLYVVDFFSTQVTFLYSITTRAKIHQLSVGSHVSILNLGEFGDKDFFFYNPISKSQKHGGATACSPSYVDHIPYGSCLSDAIYSSYMIPFESLILPGITQIRSLANV